MIRYIDSSNAARHADTLDQLFRVRHSVFVEEKGWIEFKVGIYERDQFDTEHASYVVSLDDHGDVAGCFRLYPTMQPHMLSEVFPDAVEGDVIRSPDYYELTRFHLRSDQRHAKPYLELVAAMPEIGIELGLKGFTSFIRTLRIPVMETAGLLVTPTGLPQFFNGESHTSVIFEVSQNSLDRINANRGSRESVFEHNARKAVA